MGAQNAVARWPAVPDLTTTVLTLTLAAISADSRLAEGRRSRSGRRLLSVAAMFVGALLGAATLLHSSMAFALLLQLVLVVGVCVEAGISARSRADWTWAR